jgi:hypothetical protein
MNFFQSEPENLTFGKLANLSIKFMVSFLEP